MLTALSHFLCVFDGEQCRPQLPTVVLIYYTVCLAKKKKKKPTQTKQAEMMVYLVYKKEQELGISCHAQLCLNSCVIKL